MKSIFAFVLLFFFVSMSQADTIHLATGDFDPLSIAPLIPQNLKAGLQLTGKSYYLVQFKSFPEKSWVQQLSSRATFYDYYPDNTYLISANSSDVSKIQLHPAVRWVGPYHPFYKLSPEIGKRSRSASSEMGGNYYLAVELFPDADSNAAAAAIQRIGGTSLGVFQSGKSKRIKVWLSPAALADLANVPEVQWVEPEPERTLRNSVTRWVIQSDVSNSTPVWSKGIHGEGQIIGHIDGLISKTISNPPTCYLSNSKIVKIHNQRNGGSTEQISTHGVSTAGTAAGDKSPFGSAGTSDKDGNAFAAKLAHTSLCDLDPDECDSNESTSLITLYNALKNDHNDGARIHTNSWGDDGTTSYTTDCRDIDQFSRDNETDLVIFSVSNTSSIKTPENAKNALAVGASKQAPSENSKSSGGVGPTKDGRRKPEIFAPGQNIVSASSTTSCGTSTTSGTSMAAPAIAGAAALVRQYYMNGFYPSGTKISSNGFTPTGALMKATLINGAVDMTGVSGFPNNTEGWGRLLLNNSLFFSGDSRNLIVKDVKNSSGFSSAGTQTLNYHVDGSGQSLKVTLVWTDLASATGSGSGTLLKNNLDLEVVTGNGTFKGNVFSSGGQSATGGSADTKNNVEQVLINSPASGALTIRVIAKTIVASSKQGYSLVVTGDVSD